MEIGAQGERMPGKSPVDALLWAQLELNNWKAAMNLVSCAFQTHV